MNIDPEYDAVIVREGECRGCGAELGKRAVNGYCRACVKKCDMSESKPRDHSSAARRELAQRELCRRRLLPFTQRMVSGYQAGWFHQDLAARLERFSRQVEAAEGPRLILNTPPRIGKSEQASKSMPSWHLGRNPEHRIISTTHSDRLAMDNSRDVLAYMKDQRYQQIFPGVHLDKDNKGAMGWRTQQGGMYKPAGVGAGISGYGANIFVIDDPHRDQDAYSSTVRDSIWQWYKSSARTRLLPGGGLILIQTRWVLDDLTGRVLEEEGRIEDGGNWEVVCYPALAEEDEYRLPSGRIIHEAHPKATLLRRKGEYLHPERYGEDEYAEAKQDPVVWQALYQQNPTAGDAAQFSAAMVDGCKCSFDDLPSKLTYYIAWDTAFGTKQVNDYSVGLTVGVDEDHNIWLVDLVRKRFESDDLIETLLDLYENYTHEVVGIEKTQYTVGIQSTLDRRIDERRLHGINIEQLPHGNKDKITRSKPIQAWMRRGRVFIPADAEWFDDLRSELLAFPGGRHDDIVDALAWVGLMIDDMQEPYQGPSTPGRSSWKEKLNRHVAGRGARSWKSA